MAGNLPSAQPRQDLAFTSFDISLYNEALLTRPNDPGLTAGLVEVLQQRRFRFHLEHLKRLASQPRRSCQLASNDTSTELPFARLMRDGTHVRAYGLNVKLNNHNAQLEVDTGAGGLLISRSLAKQAGLEQFSATEVGGVGNDGEKSAYTAYVDSIKIGSLE